MTKLSNGILAACLALIAYPVIGGLAAKSEVPRFFGRYSTFMLVFEAAGLVLIAVGVWLLLSDRTRGRAWVLALIIGFSVLCFGSLAISRLTGIAALMWLSRMLAGMGMIVTAFQAFRMRAGHRIPLSLGVLTLCLCVSDAAFAAAIRSRQVAAGVGQNPFRYDYNLAEITNRDFVFLGDSYVWGCGVPEGKEFGSLFGHSLAGRGRSWVLGHIGGNLHEYASHARSIPFGIKARRLIICYYHNDMPAPERLADRLQSLALSLGKAVPSLVFVSDRLAKAQTPTAQSYLRSLADNNDPNGPQFDERLGQIKDQISACFEAAKPKSLEPPVFVILPILDSFDNYPLAAAHKRLARLASDAGFQALDTLPAFLLSEEPAEQLWAAPNDPHFNERANQIMADFLINSLVAGTDT